MEGVTILIGVAVFIISALMIYCISAFSMREQTFEEVMEAQRRRQEEEKEKAKAEKRAEKDQIKKKYKKGKDKNKDKAAPVPEPELKVEHKMVNLEIEPEIIAPTEHLGLNTALRQRGKKEKQVKPILHNKEEIVLIAEKAVEMKHKPVAPKDEVELKKAHEKVVEEKKVVVEKMVVVEKIEKIRAVPQQSEVKEAKMSKRSIESKENLPPKSDEPHKQSKGTPTKKKIDDTPMNGSHLISSVRTAKLTDEEHQTLIEILLNKQGSSSSMNLADSWNKKSQKGDPVPLLKKQLEEKERALQEEQNMAMAANSKVKELKAELGTEKTKCSALEKKCQEKVSHQQAEQDALQQRMQHTHEQHLMETNGLQAKLRQLEQGVGDQAAGDQATVKKLSAENKILQETLLLKAKECVSLGDKVKQTEKELNNSTNKIQANEASRKSLESKSSSYEEKIKNLENDQKDSNSVINKRVEEVAVQLRKSESRNESIASDLKHATSALTAAEAEVSNLKGKLEELETHLNWADASRDANKDSEVKLQESERKRSDLEGNIKNLEKQLADSSKRLNDSKMEIKSLQQENRSLVDENKKISENVQSAPASNGDIHDHEKTLAKKDEEVTALTANLESQKKASASLQVKVDTQLAQVTELQQQLAQQKAKNNELREKNWKAMEALEKAEKSSAQKADKALKSARELSSAGASEVETCDRSVFQRLFPEIQVSDKLAHKDWVSAFEKLAAKKIQSAVSEDSFKTLEGECKKYKAQSSDYECQIVELNKKSERLQTAEKEVLQLKSKQSSQVDTSQQEEEIKRLKEEVENYRNIVSETEKKVKQLEDSIDSEVKKWKAKLKEAELSSSQNSDDKRISELDATVKDQEKQLQEYRNVMSLTENSLKQLESKVITEENSWQEKLNSTQSQLGQTQDELNNLKKQVLDSRGSQEMQTKVKVLETQLNESQEKITVLTTEKVTHVKETVSVDKGFEKEVTDLRSQVNTERKKNKDLSFNVVKLNGIIKTGQDALSQEQVLVKKLQEQLDNKSLKSGVSDLDEIDQLRVKLSEKQKLLEREMSANKQLSERLGQLGILAATSTENGTSV